MIHHLKIKLKIYLTLQIWISPPKYGAYRLLMKVKHVWSHQPVRKTVCMFVGISVCFFYDPECTNSTIRQMRVGKAAAPGARHVKTGQVKWTVPVVTYQDCEQRAHCDNRFFLFLPKMWYKIKWQTLRIFLSSFFTSKLVHLKWKINSTDWNTELQVLTYKLA